MEVKVTPEELKAAMEVARKNRTSGKAEAIAAVIHLEMADYIKRVAEGAADPEVLRIDVEEMAERRSVTMDAPAIKAVMKTLKADGFRIKHVVIDGSDTGPERNFLDIKV